jgi:pyridoxamine 5'-phosphate oxidase
MDHFERINRLINTLRETTPEPAPLSKSELLADPFEQFCAWFELAVEANQPQANAVCLASANIDGQPSARMVLLKDVEPEGFVVYTNIESRKGRELIENPKAALLFYWEMVRRQVRITGRVEQVSREQSIHYFQSRHPGSQLGAWASPQSKAVTSRAELNQRLIETEKQFADVEPPYPLPPQWGGFRIVPEAFEFWQHRRERLHDRFAYARMDDGDWSMERLAP